MTHLEYHRRRRRLTQRQLGALAHVLQNDISGFERGRMNPRPDELERLASVFGLPPDVLMQPVLASVEAADLPRAEAAAER
jgi:transcriptional regulator with XRE-family HTH domain